MSHGLGRPRWRVVRLVNGLKAEVDVERRGQLVVGRGLDGGLAPQRRTVLVDARAVAGLLRLGGAVGRRIVEMVDGEQGMVVLPADASGGVCVVVIAAREQRADGGGEAAVVPQVLGGLEARVHLAEAAANTPLVSGRRDTTERQTETHCV